MTKFKPHNPLTLTCAQGANDRSLDGSGLLTAFAEPLEMKRFSPRNRREPRSFETLSRIRRLIAKTRRPGDTCNAQGCREGVRDGIEGLVA